MVSDDIDISSMTVEQLREIAKEKDIEKYSSMKKIELIQAISEGKV